MSRQLLRKSKVVIKYRGRVYELSALSQFSASTSLGEVTQRRKTLFSNTPKQYTHTDRINSTSTTLEVYLTDNYLESVFFELVGLDRDAGSRAFLPQAVNVDTRVFSMYIVNEDSTMYSEHNYVKSIDISLSKASILSLSIDIDSANLVPLGRQGTIGSEIQGTPLGPAPLNLTLDKKSWNTIKSASISIQQEAGWIDNKSLFSAHTTDTYKYTKARTSDLTISATIQTNYETTSSIFNEAVYQDILIAKGTFGLIIENARVVHNLDIQPIYGNRLDISVAELSGDTYFYFGE